MLCFIQVLATMPSFFPFNLPSPSASDICFHTKKSLHHGFLISYSNLAPGLNKDGLREEEMIVSMRLLISLPLITLISDCTYSERSLFFTCYLACLFFISSTWFCLHKCRQKGVTLIGSFYLWFHYIFDFVWKDLKHPIFDMWFNSYFHCITMILFP